MRWPLACMLSGVGALRCGVRSAARWRVAAPSATALSATTTLSAFEDISDKYDALLLDQFGVVHGGAAAYDGSAELVSALQKRGKRLVVLSNSSKRRRDTVERLQAMGCGMCTYLDQANVVEGIPAISVFTSGDLVHDSLLALASPSDPSLFDSFLPRGANRVFCFGNGDDDEFYLRSCGAVPTRIEDADYVLARGLFATLGGDVAPLDFEADGECDELLRAAAARDLPMIVANPDLVRPDGGNSPMPGRLMARYRDHFGGRVFPVGKPHADIYKAALNRGLAGVDRSRVCAVGDSMLHDVAGAAAAGVDSCFVASGIHALELGVAPGGTENVDAATLATFLESFPAQPMYAVPGFSLRKE
ncbi:HAD-like domain-containing protein [Pelagophyceae sp. CCMP2097]|nr:HAD-like domain-containing protein [Pelagophyceae sp. CCMP2097]